MHLLGGVIVNSANSIMHRPLLVVVVLQLLCVSMYAISIGDMMERDYTVYDPLPIILGDATAQGWYPVQENKTCIEGLGIPFVQVTKSEDEKKRPITLYFTPGGQVTGIGVAVSGAQKANLVTKGYFIPLEDTVATDAYPNAKDLFYMSVTFRESGSVCASTVDASLPLGDRLVLNAASPQRATLEALPVTASDASAAGWMKGSCFSGMGTHYFKDLTQNGTLSWESANMVPISLMFDEESEDATGNINAFFFTATTVQQSIFPPCANQWEPVPLTGGLMCKNLCADDCKWQDTEFFSTLHIYLNTKRPNVTCHDKCTISCCK
jgi:hypothetical protein